MLDQTTLEKWFLNNEMTIGARQQINRVRLSEPARLTKSGKRNIAGRYPSKKMGRMIQFESHKNELPCIHRYDHDDNVLELWDQPPSFRMNFHSDKGRNIGIIHTADFFVIYTGSAGWEECKLEDDLIDLALKYPDRYVQDSDGTWRCPPGEQFAAQFGLTYLVRSASEINWIMERNYVFLDDYYRDENQPIPEASMDAILRLVTSNPGIRLKALLEEADLVNADDLYLMILLEEIYVDLERQPLGEPDLVNVYPDALTAQAMRLIESRERIPVGEPATISVVPGSSIHWDGNTLTVKHVGQESVWLTDSQGELIPMKCDSFEQLIREGSVKVDPCAGLPVKPLSDRFKQIDEASLEDLQVATQRLQVIAPLLNHTKPSPVISRSAYRWMESFRTAELLYGDGFLGLIPLHSRKGNTDCRLPETIDFAKEYIEEFFLTNKQSTQKSEWEVFAKQCEEKGLPLLSFESFCKIIRNMPEYDKKKARMGNRAAYPHTPFFYELEYTTPRHGERPFEIGHIDHTELDLEFIDSKTGANLGRVWITKMLDAFSRRILAYSLSYESPSYKSLMMVMRECVRRHGRLPQILVVDGGKEFHGVDMELLCARYEITKKKRRPAKGRDGSVLERLFGTMNTQMIYNLQGNTQITKHVRIMTKSVDPKKHAIWTIEKFNIYFSIWAYEVYDSCDHPALGVSPRDAFTNGIRSGGKRLSRMIVYDQKFILETLPLLDEKGSKIHGNGIIINGINYWNKDFIDPKVRKAKVKVRYDPFNVGIAYAFVNKKWIECRSDYFEQLNGKSESEIKAISAEIVKRRQNIKSTERVRAKHLAEYITELRNQEAQLIEERRAAENKKVFPPEPESTNEWERYTCPPALAQQPEKSDSKDHSEQFDDEYNYGGAMS